jgi:hypothetical protein
MMLQIVGSVAVAGHVEEFGHRMPIVFTLGEVGEVAEREYLSARSSRTVI